MQPVETYIQQFPSEVQSRLNELRAIIFQYVPEVNESISYGMPAYKTFGKPLIYFAGYKNHIGLYATPSGHKAFAEELSIYKQGKGSVQFPLNLPMPIDLISNIIKFRKEENEQTYGKQ